MMNPTSTIVSSTQAKYPHHDDPAWLSTAFKEIGTQEITGDAQHSQRVLQYHACTGLGATTDETPWCSSFLCWVMDQCNVTSTRSAASLSWLRWGKELKSPVRGCVVIFERMGKNGQVIPNRGHVALWLGQQGRITYVLGGNQRNQVGVNAYRTDRIIGYRWPSAPHKSTTNIASTVVGTAATATTAPTIVGLLGQANESVPAGSSFTDAVSTAHTVAEQIGIPTSNLIAMAGLVVVIVGLSYIVRERNLKIKRFGI